MEPLKINAVVTDSGVFLSDTTNNYSNIECWCKK